MLRTKADKTTTGALGRDLDFRMIPSQKLPKFKQSVVADMCELNCEAVSEDWNTIGQAMPIIYLRALTGPERTEAANRQLARYLAFVAGAVNAGGFLAVRQYTSHMTGIISAMADNLALGSWPLVLMGLRAVLSFLSGASFTALMIRWARHRELESAYALPLTVEALMLILFGLTGYAFDGRRVLSTISLLCFTMGLQNAILTKISGAVIRTTHLTGMVTDLGIKLGRIAYALLNHVPIATSVEMSKLRLLASLVVLFFVGGVIGALGFRHTGFFFTVPLAVVLLILAAVPVIDDLRGHYSVRHS